MDFLELLKKNKINLDKDIKKLCLDALDIMRESHDPKHDYIHVKDMLKELSKLVQYEKDIDFNVLLPAICWHDAWQAKQPATNSSHVLFFRYFYEGFGSAKSFGKYAQKYGIEKALKNKIKTAIFQHVRTGWTLMDKLFLSPGQLETKILKDLDELDTWNIKRLERLKKVYLKNKLPTRYLWIIRWYFKIMLDSTKQLFYLEYSKKEFESRKKAVIDWAIENYTIIRNNPRKYLKEEYKGTFFDLTPKELKRELYSKL
ncbi:MAG: hypothetical protein ABIJ34_00940 [archaeon]